MILRCILSLGFLMQANNETHACDRSEFPVAIDVGHSVTQPGAISAHGIGEFVFNLRLAREVVKALQAAGFDHAFLVEDSGKSVALTKRPQLAQKRDARLFLSIHHDSVQPHYLSDWQVGGQTRKYSDRFSGHSLFVSSLNLHAKESIAFATRLGQALRKRQLQPSAHHAEPITGENRPLLDPAMGLYRYDGLAVLRTATMPAVLLEAGIIVNRADEKRLERSAHRGEIAAAVVDAVVAMCETADPDAPSSHDVDASQTCASSVFNACWTPDARRSQSQERKIKGHQPVDNRSPEHWLPVPSLPPLRLAATRSIRSFTPAHGE